MSTYYYLRGPINNKAQVLLGVVHEGYLFFLTKNGNNPILDPRNPTLLGGPEPVILNVNEVNNNTQVSVSIVGFNNVVLDTNNYLMNGTQSPSVLTPSALDINASSLLVAGPYYTLSSAVGTANVYAYTPVPPTNQSTDNVFAPDILLDENGNAVLQTLSANLRLIPIKWYLADNCSQTLSTLNEVITNEALWTEFELFQTETNFQTGFTVQQDCNNGVFYNYCFLPANCGEANNCNGACANSSQKCSLNTSTGNFSCTGSSSSSNWWWWLIIGIIALLVIILLIVAIWYFASGSKGETETTVYEQTTVAPRQQYGFVEETFSGESELI